jgi:long-chain acyl-CoA synthetase
LNASIVSKETGETAVDVINRSLARNTDTVHAIHFLRDGIIQKISLAELDRQSISVALHLRELGVRPGDRVGIAGKNCLEWVLLDRAVLKLGGVTCGFDAGRFVASMAIEKYGLNRMFVEEVMETHSCIHGFDVVRQWAGEREESPGPLHEGYKPHDVCAIKFTSGSTGPAKGMEAIVGGINDSLTDVQEMFEHTAGDNILVFLRLAQLQQRYWIYSAMAFHHDIAITTLDHVFPMAQAVNPTVVMGVPGFFEDLKRQLESEAGYPADDLKARGRAVQAKLGGRIRYLWTGSAPASRATLDYYFDCGVSLYQGYGLNETCIIAKNCPKANRIGSVGKVLSNKTLRIDSQGMLIVGSRNPIIKGYMWGKPGDNERLFMPSGEIKTYDLGYLDEDGYLFIQGRIDDLIVLGTGRNVLVGPLEEKIKLHPGVHECVLYGTGKPFVTALVSPANELLDHAALEKHLQEINKTLFPEQQIRGLVISPAAFSMDNGLLTSQYKPIRKEIYRYLEPQIEAVYNNTNVLWRGAYGQ